MEVSDAPALAQDLGVAPQAEDRELILLAFATMTGVAARSFNHGEKPRSGAAMQRHSGLRSACFGEPGRNVSKDRKQGYPATAKPVLVRCS